VLSEREKLLLGKFVERYRDSEAGRLVKGVVHNMNNLLHTMSMQVELLKRRLVNLAKIDDPEKFDQEKVRCLSKIDEVTGEMARLNDMIRTMVSKGIHDEANDPGPVDLSALLAEEIAIHDADMFFKHKVEKKTDLAPDLPSVYGFHVDFAQALGAVIQNSLDAMQTSEQRQLSISTRQENGSVLVSITDTGCGLPNGGSEARLFEPFFTTKEAAEGHAGLGLYVAKTLLAAYGGEITASRSEGGTTVCISVPAGRRAV
jgi:two-component system NtrC family sensor kinase